MADLMSGYYQAQEMSTMVSALSRVVAEDDPWAAEAYPWASGGGVGMEEQAMRGGGGGYVHELGSFPSSEFAGNSQHTHAAVVASLVDEEESFPCLAFCLSDFILPHRASHASLSFLFLPVFILACYSISKRGTLGQSVWG
jgi:hypothetical protein